MCCKLEFPVGALPWIPFIWGMLEEEGCWAQAVLTSVATVVNLAFSGDTWVHHVFDAIRQKCERKY